MKSLLGYALVSAAAIAVLVTCVVNFFTPLAPTARERELEGQLRLERGHRDDLTRVIRDKEKAIANLKDTLVDAQLTLFAEKNARQQAEKEWLTVRYLQLQADLNSAQRRLVEAELKREGAIQFVPRDTPLLPGVVVPPGDLIPPPAMPLPTTPLPEEP